MMDPALEPNEVQETHAPLKGLGYETTRITVPIAGALLDLLISYRVRTSSAPVPRPGSQPQQQAALADEKATENQVRKIFAEMHRIGEPLGQAYMQGHFGTKNPKELHKKTASTLIKWLISQPDRKE